MNVSPTQSNIQAALAAFLAAVLPPLGGDGKPVSVVAAVENRVPEPDGVSFVVMSPLRFARLATNQDTSADSKFTASIAANVMTVTAVDPGVGGTVNVGATIFGVGVAASTVVQAQLTGAPGGVGMYQVSVSQTLGSRTLSAGQESLLQEAEVVVQLDFHSAPPADGTPDPAAASDMAQTVATTLRDEFGVNFFAGLAPPLNAVAPLYADDPRYMPFINESQQYEWRWVLDVHLQANQVVAVPQQFTDSLSVVLVSVDAAYPPH
jgi:hypothetical protein